MNKKALLSRLENDQIIDLYQLYQECQPVSLFELVEQLQQLKEEHQLNTKLSHLVSQVDRVLESFSDADSAEKKFTDLATQLDINLRSGNMSRYIMSEDNHRHFAPKADLVMFGDSITEWAPWVDALRPLNLVNRGLAGDTTRGMLARIDLTLAVEPKVVCIMAGINDLAQGYKVEQVLDNYIAMLNTWIEKGIIVVVQSTLYVGERIAALNDDVRKLNHQLAQFCHDNQLHFLDVNSSLAPQGVLPVKFSCDDLHLNAAAYQAWLEVLRPTLSEYLTE